MAKIDQELKGIVKVMTKPEKWGRASGSFDDPYAYADGSSSFGGVCGGTDIYTKGIDVTNLNYQGKRAKVSEIDGVISEKTIALEALKDKIDNVLAPKTKYDASKVDEANAMKRGRDKENAKSSALANANASNIAEIQARADYDKKTKEISALYSQRECINEKANAELEYLQSVEKQKVADAQAKGTTYVPDAKIVSSSPVPPANNPVKAENPVETAKANANESSKASSVNKKAIIIGVGAVILIVGTFLILRRK